MILHAMTSVRHQLSARTNYQLIFVSPMIPHYACVVVTRALLVQISWQWLSVILLLLSHPASGRTPVVYKKCLLLLFGK